MIAYYQDKINVRQDVVTSEEYNLHSAISLSSSYSVLIHK